MTDAVVLEYRKPERRRVFAWEAAALTLVLLLAVGGCCRWLAPWLSDAAAAHELDVPPISYAFLWIGAQASYGMLRWIVLGTIPLLVGFLAAWRNKPGASRERIGIRVLRHGVATLAVLLVLAVFTAVAFIQPLTPRVRSMRALNAGATHFHSLWEVYMYLARQGDMGEDALLHYARKTRDEEIDFAPHGTLHIFWVERDGMYGVRGAQDNGAIVLMLERSPGEYDVVADAGGNYYEFDALAKKLTTSWHMSASESVVEEWEWNGRVFTQTRRLSVDARDPHVRWKDFFPKAAATMAPD